MFRVVPETPRPQLVEEPQLSVVEPVDRGKNDKFKRNLLSKRRTYQKYFERGLSTIDDKLRKIALARGIKERVRDEAVEYAANGVSIRKYLMKPFRPNPDEQKSGHELTRKSKKYMFRLGAKLSKVVAGTQQRLAIRNLNAKERRHVLHLEFLQGFARRQVQFGHLPSVCPLHECNRPECVAHWLSQGYERVGDPPTWTRKAPLKRSNAMRGKGKKKR